MAAHDATTPFGSEALEALANALAPHLVERLAAAAPSPPKGALLDADGAARLLGLHNAKGEPLVSWVLAEARANRIPHVRLGRYVRFDGEELERWWRARSQGPQR